MPVMQIGPLREGEVAWRDKQLEGARLLAERYTGDTETLPTIDRLEAVVVGWLDDDSSRVDINMVVNTVGIAVGQHIADIAQLSWVIATDEQGSDLALHGQPGDILVYPANATAKRLTNGERYFLASMISQLVAGIEQRRQRQ
jgi:hypothetical protein